jgi:hypothetical protein
MSDVTTHVRFETKFAKAVDVESTRYALSAAEVIPAGDGKTVYASATDSRQLSVVRCKGETDRRVLIPGAMLPNRKPTTRKPFTVSKNGRWETSDGKFTDRETEGRFPRVCDVIPEVSTETHISLTLDVRYLSKIADATGATSLTMLVPLPVENTYDKTAPKHCVTRTVCVLPNSCDGDHADGFGVIMPLTGSDADFAAFNTKREAYAAAHDAVRQAEKSAS